MENFYPTNYKEYLVPSTSNFFYFLSLSYNQFITLIRFEQVDVLWKEPNTVACTQRGFNPSSPLKIDKYFYFVAS